MAGLKALMQRVVGNAEKLCRETRSGDEVRTTDIANRILEHNQCTILPFQTESIFRINNNNNNNKGQEFVFHVFVSAGDKNKKWTSDCYNLKILVTKGAHNA